MSEVLEQRLRAFARTVFERRGALVEWPDGADEGWAMLPPELAARLSQPEMLRLVPRPDASGLSVNLATDFLERIAPLVEIEPREAAFQIPELYLKRAAMDEPIARAFTWLNAKVRVTETSAERVEYHAWSFLVSIQSEDRWEDVVTLTLNGASGAQVPFVDPLTLGEGQAALESSVEPDTYRQAARRVAAEVEQRAAAFVERMDGRLQRDRKRLRDYYGALLKETQESRAHAEPDAGKTEAKRRAVELELRRKVSELEERYRIRVELTPLLRMRIEMPVLAIELDVFRKQARRKHTVYWNPVLTALEPMCCARCGASAFAVAFADETVDVRCAGCAK